MDRREFLKTYAALGVTVSIPGLAIKGVLADLDFIGSWEPTFMLPTYANPGKFPSEGRSWSTVNAEAIHLTDYYVDEQRLSEAISVGPPRLKDGQGYVECSMDTIVMWSAVEFIDSEGRRWTTEDGDRWECRDLWFEL